MRSSQASSARAQHRKYKTILTDFLQTGKRVQVLKIEGESPHTVKEQLDYIISFKGWRNKVAVLILKDSIMLVNKNK